MPSANAHLHSEAGRPIADAQLRPSSSAAAAVPVGAPSPVAPSQGSDGIPAPPAAPGPLKPGRGGWLIIAILAVFVVLGGCAYARQFTMGLQVTGLARQAPWGLYIGQLAFLIGVAASAVMVVLPYSLHHDNSFARITLIGESLSISALVTAVLFVFVDIGQPARLLNVLLYPSPSSLMFWDCSVVFGYLVVNMALLGSALRTARTATPPPFWYRPLVYLSIPLAFAIHTVTALLFAGLAARPGWMSAILAPRFLASAFASGPALLILLGIGLRQSGRFDVGQEAIRKLTVIATYALFANVFFGFLEAFTALYSGVSEHGEHFTYLFFGLDGHGPLVPWMWTSLALSIAALVMLLLPRTRRCESMLVCAALAIIVGVWLDKGLCLVVSGFVPDAAGEVFAYSPTWPEIAVSVGIYSLGALLFGGVCAMCLNALRASPERVS